MLLTAIFANGQILNIEGILMTSRTHGQSAAIAKIAFHQAGTVAHGFSTEQWIDHALILFNEMEETDNVYWNPCTGEQGTQNIDLDIEDSDFVEIAKECKERAFQELSDEFQANGSDTAKRIVTLLSSDIGRDALNYIRGLVETHGIEGAATLDHNDRIGLCVFEGDDGEQTLQYGDYSSGPYNYDCVYCNMENILDAAEDGDEIPDWLGDDESTIVEVLDCSAAYGYVLMSKAERDSADRRTQ
jgi:hypothetical protein